MSGGRLYPKDERRIVSLTREQDMWPYEPEDLTFHVQYPDSQFVASNNESSHEVGSCDDHEGVAGDVMLNALSQCYPGDMNGDVFPLTIHPEPDDHACS